MAYDVDFDDLDYGDETRERGDYVALPHDEANDSIPEGHAVTFDGTHIQNCTADTDALVGVLQHYDYYDDAVSGSNTVDQDSDAIVKTSGVVKARVESTVSAGDALVGGTTTNGVFDTLTTETQAASAVALSDARQQDNDVPNGGTGEYYAEVLLR